MPTPASPSLSSAPASIRRGRFILFCIWTLIIFGAGLYLGNSATKNAVTGPEWMARILGVSSLRQGPPQMGNASVPPPTGAAQQGTVNPAQGPAPTAPGPGDPGKGQPLNSGAGAPPSSASTSAAPGFLGSWVSEEDVMLENNTPKKVTSIYTFNADGSGEYSVDGQKTADLKWENSGDQLNTTFTTGNGSSGRFWKVRQKWFANPERTLLTLVPEGAQDANAEMGTGGTKTLRRK